MEATPSPYRFTTCPVDNGVMETAEQPSADALYHCPTCESSGRFPWHMPKNPARVVHGAPGFVA